MKKLILSTLLIVPLAATAQTAYQKMQFCELNASVAKASALLREIHIPREIAIKRVEEAITQPEIKVILRPTIEAAYDSYLSSGVLETLYKETCMKKMFDN